MTCENCPWKPMVQSFVGTINAENHLGFFWNSENLVFLEPATKIEIQDSYKNKWEPPTTGWNKGPTLI
jgi:hypothetical protein